MAFVFYRKRDIDAMDVDHIPEDFINYFKSLDDAGKAALIADRRDIGAALGFYPPRSVETKSDPPIIDDAPAPVVPARAMEDLQLTQIRHNCYDGKDVMTAVRDNMPKFEALTIPDGTKRCIVHKDILINKNIKYKDRSGTIRGVPLFICRKCNRIFVEAHSTALIRDALSKANAECRIYPLSISSRYLQGKIPVRSFTDKDILYIPETWIEEKPTCPIHGDALYGIPCAKRYKDREISFTGFICGQCGKIMVRRSVASDLEDECMNAGIPSIQFEPIRRNAPKKKLIPSKDVSSDYMVENGKRTQYTYKVDSSCYQLTEGDIVVVSDSIYCPLEGHDSEELVGLIHVQEKKGGRKAYLFRLGYCSICQKYYMEQVDHDVVQRYGRAEITIQRDTEDTDALITSGNEFNRERDHLNDVEGAIKEEEDSIRAKPDYVSQYAGYATGGYDDGDLTWKKSQSRRLYQPRLVALAGYKPKPYLYRVDIANGDQFETYYIGEEDVILNGKQWVISRESDLGRELINYQTIQVHKDGRDYSITLSRAFDIYNMTLYGYRNIRTDEDAIFKSGLTDPFLVRVLKTRKRQHQLTDIFVTIQKYQNIIISEDYSTNLIVQGCAGSGKTMVLLHRLSALQYREHYSDFANDALILTPNEQFAFHIQGIAEDLKIGNIARTSVQQYYLDMLSKYSPEFKLKKSELSSEQNIRRQEFVDYVYSDAFRADFSAAYEAVISERNALSNTLRKLAKSMGEPVGKLDLSDDPKVEQQLRTNAEALRHKIEGREAALAAAMEDHAQLEESKRQLARRLSDRSRAFSEAIDESASSVRIKIELFQDQRRREIAQLEKRFDGLQAKRARLLENIQLRKAEAQEKRHQRKQYLQEQTTALSQRLTETVSSLRSSAKSKIEAYQSQKQRAMFVMEARLESLRAEKKRTQNGILSFRRKAKLDKLAEHTRAVQRELDLERARRAEEALLFRVPAEGSCPDVYFAWLSKVYEIIPEVREEVVQYTDLRDRLHELAYELKGIDAPTKTDDESDAELDGCEADMRDAQAELERSRAEFQQVAPALNAPADGASADERFAWFTAVMAIIPEVREEFLRCKQLRGELKRESDKLGTIDAQIDAAEGLVADTRNALYPADVKQMSINLCKEIEKYSVMQTFQLVFDRAVDRFKTVNRISRNISKYHRYDLYAMLLFCMRFFGRAISTYRFICVDEGQDLALNEYRLLHELNGRKAVFNVFGDTHQLMKPGRGISDWTVLQNAFNAKVFTLNENYRNTNQITRFCNSSFGMDVMQTGVDGPNVREISRRDLEEELAGLEMGSERLAILVPRSLPKDQYLDLKMLPLSIAEAIGEKMDGGCIALMYVDEVKGIEFDRVYVDSGAMSTNERYIAYTRALSELILIVDKGSLTIKKSRGSKAK